MPDALTLPLMLFVIVLIALAIDTIRSDYLS